MDEARLMRDGVERFARSCLEPHLATVEGYPGAVPAEVIEGLDALGLRDVDVSDAGGRMLLAQALEALASHAGSCAALALADIAARALLTDAPAGRGAFPLYEELRHADPRLLVGSVGALPHLAGEARMVVGAPMAAWLALPAGGDPDGPATHLAVVSTTAPGVRVGAPIRTLGMRGAHAADVVVEGVAVPRCHVVPLDADRLACLRGPALAIGAGLAASSLADALAYARERIQGGRPIVEHDEVRDMLAGMRAAVALCRSAARTLCEDPSEAELFVHAREQAARAAADGVQVLGGNGYMEDYGQERRMRDARQACFLFGRGTELRLARLVP